MCQLLVQLSRLREGERMVFHLYLYYIILRWFTSVIVSQSIWARTPDVLMVYIGYACTFHRKPHASEFLCVVFERL